ncbi:hypothetical protein FACS1894200_06200 [Spirochaetia bacterium]|nr:hypothetical protein FACS1894200_06200 [Spirochaetia bacterium]
MHSLAASMRLEEAAHEEISGKAASLAERFFNSSLGKRSLAAQAEKRLYKTEYPIITHYRSSDETRIIKGRIDILFEEAGVITVIDFKTDREEDVGRHALQLGLYQQAVSDIFGKPVQCYVFFLRTGHAVDLTEDAQSALLGG